MTSERLRRVCTAFISASVLACGRDPYTVGPVTSERVDSSLCALVALSESVVVSSSAVLGVNGAVTFPSTGNRIDMTRVDLSTDEVMLGPSGAKLSVYFLGGIADGVRWRPRNYSFAGDLSGVLGGARGIWFSHNRDNTLVVIGEGLLTEQGGVFVGIGDGVDGGVTVDNVRDEVSRRTADPTFKCPDAGI